MRGGDKNHSLDERQRGEEDPFPQQFAGFLIDLNLFKGLAADAVPEARSAIDGGQFGEQSALTVTRHDHAPQGGVLALGVKLLHGSRQGRTQAAGRDTDRVTGFIGK